MDNANGPRFEVGSTSTGFSVVVDFSAVSRLINAIPKVSLYRFRSYFFQCLLELRKHWLGLKSNKFGRGGGGAGEPIGVSQIQSERETAKPNEVLYVIKPDERRAATREAALALISKMRADIFTGNAALQAWLAGPRVVEVFVPCPSASP